MAFPLTTLADIRAGDLASATPGSLVSLPWEHQMLTGLALGEPGAAASGILVDVDGMPSVRSLQDFWEPFALHGDKPELVLDIRDDEVDARRLHNHLGTLALTSEGMMVVAATSRDAFARAVPGLICLKTFRVLGARHDLYSRTVWLTSWSLMVRDATDNLVRVVGNPVWPDALRIQR